MILAADRPEADAHLGRAMALDPEQAGQDADGQGHDVGRKHRRRNFQTFHRGQHRDGRCNQSVAIEQRRAEQSERHGNAPRGRRQLVIRQHARHQRHDAALATVVGTQDQRHVLERDDHDQRPEHQRQDAEHVVRRDRHRMVGVAEHFLDRIQRAGADVAIDHTERGEGEDGGLVLLRFLAHGGVAWKLAAILVAQP